MKKEAFPEQDEKERQDANACVALGAGVGVFGAAAAALTGAVCPLCIIIAPGLVGYGAYRRWKTSAARSASPRTPSGSPGAGT